MATRDEEDDIRLTLFIIASCVIISSLMTILGITVCMILCKKDPEIGGDNTTNLVKEHAIEGILSLEDILDYYSFPGFEVTDNLFNRRALSMGPSM